MQIGDEDGTGCCGEGDGDGDGGGDMRIRNKRIENR